MMRIGVVFLFVMGSLLAAPQEIVVRKAASGKMSVSTSTVRHDQSENARLFMKVLNDNLQRSGWFSVIDSTSAGYMVRGQVLGTDGIAVNVTVSAMGTESSFTWTRRGTTEEVRDVAHALCDAIVKAVTKKPGMAGAPILFVGKRDGKTDIYSCDADGGRVKRLTQEGKICLSPAWKPDRSGFYYTGFLKNAPAVYQVNFAKDGGMTRDAVSALPGLNGCAAPSPDGKSLALVLSVSGNVELYTMELPAKKATRVTYTPHANEASPSWSPDSRQIAYVSDSSRAPQVFMANKGAKEGTRIVFGLAESVSPSWGPDGRIAFCGRPSGGRYGIYVITQGGAPEQISPNTGDDFQEPSWAPDGRHIVATRIRNYTRSLVILDTMGDPPVDLISGSGEWYLANWAVRSDKL
ncbi:MAG: hypothetical protein FWF84_08215 [Kiritimatiellaeota bacterium]|nr:hypothetical protein [Kiritimatiellota bacterium]